MEKYKNYTTLIGLSLLAMLCTLSGATQAANKMRADTGKVNEWNVFADNLYRLHEIQLKEYAVRTEERRGGYPDMPDYYREVTYYAQDDGRLLSRIQLTNDDRVLLHSIEVYVYDDTQRLTIDYLAAYLPGGRNAPVQTLISLHGYQGDVHAFRLFDASGDLVGEQCRRNDPSQEILLMLDIDELYAAHRNNGMILQSALYEQCFGGIPQELSESHYPASLLRE